MNQISAKGKNLDRRLKDIHYWVGERCIVGRSQTGRTGGRSRSENVGTSSDKTGEKPVRRKPEVSWARLILPGLVGPKPRPRGVGEGKRVNIPYL